MNLQRAYDLCAPHLSPEMRKPWAKLCRFSWSPAMEKKLVKTLTAIFHEQRMSEYVLVDFEESLSAGSS